MRFAIDAVFVGEDGRVTKVVPHLRPWRVVWWARGARDCLELGVRGGCPQRHAARRRAATGAGSLDLARHREAVHLLRPRLRQHRCARLQRGGRGDDVVDHDHPSAGTDAPARTPNAPRRFARRAARSSRCCFVVGRVRSRTSAVRWRVPGGQVHARSVPPGCSRARAVRSRWTGTGTSVAGPLTLEQCRSSAERRLPRQDRRKARARRCTSAPARARRTGPSCPNAAIPTSSASPITIPASGAANRSSGRDGAAKAATHARHRSDPGPTTGGAGRWQQQVQQGWHRSDPASTVAYRPVIRGARGLELRPVLGVVTACRPRYPSHRDRRRSTPRRGGPRRCPRLRDRPAARPSRRCTSRSS